MKRSILRFAGIALLLALPACTANLDTSLPRDLAGQKLEGRLGVLRAACVTHASHHDNRKNKQTGNYLFVENCDAMAARIQGASRGIAGGSIQPLVAECRAQADNVRFKQSGPSAKGLSYISQRPAFRRDARTLCAQYEKEFANVNRNQ